ncbi:hypothetical protein BCV69DRAFT_275766 [Microstroma glucosiphilum]|uniref:Uncharacterized protein n=1 Tax=Pseudomicrostroma glucosiphilum TaxID=1684307 RepID=A0A316UCC7_9BASI|nr:hypothetical protein BCV69DRAFT_275766 [Pseudomicrostroma glucosiphilum]PWN22887.1 hypothetical protein BCV69DRAFT_275766 [Pseudomicrostroma glucosiphilum]
MKLPYLAFILVLLSATIVAATSIADDVVHRSTTHKDPNSAGTVAFASTSRLAPRAGRDWRRKMKMKLKNCVACGAPPDSGSTSSGGGVLPYRSGTGGRSPLMSHGASTSRSRHASPDRAGTTRQGSPSSSNTVASPAAGHSHSGPADSITVRPDMRLPHRVDLRLIEGEYAVPFVVCPVNEQLGGSVSEIATPGLLLVRGTITSPEVFPYERVASHHHYTCAHDALAAPYRAAGAMRPQSLGNFEKSSDATTYKHDHRVAIHLFGRAIDEIVRHLGDCGEESAGQLPTQAQLPPSAIAPSKP